MKSDLLGIWTIVRKPVLGRTLRLHRLKASYGGLDLLRRQAVNVEVQAHCQPHQCQGDASSPGVVEHIDHTLTQGQKKLVNLFIVQVPNVTFSKMNSRGSTLAVRRRYSPGFSL